MTYKLLHYIDFPEDVNVDLFDEMFIDLIENFGGTTFGIIKECEHGLYVEDDEDE